MSTFNVEIEVGNSDQSRFETVKALVDTNATYAQLPDHLLRDLGITPIELRTLVVAGGHRINRHIGEAPLRIDDKVFTCPVIFMDDGVHPILGYTTLNAFGLGVEGQQLVPVDLYLLKDY